MAAANHYTRAEIRSLLGVARAYKLDVIPLVQTFGHLEYVLKAAEFARIRENPAVPQALCPSQNESLVLVEQLVDQVAAERFEIIFVDGDEY